MKYNFEEYGTYLLDTGKIEYTEGMEVTQN
jgi:hypothetical protein